MRKHYSSTFKADAIKELMKEEKTISQLATELGVHPTQLKEWKKIAFQGLPELFSREGKARPGAPDRLKHMSNKSTNCITRLAA